jgi:hypothetical protein
MFKGARDWILAGLIVVALGSIFVYFKDLSGDLKGNASTATALAANPNDCQKNNFATGIDEQANLSCAKITDADLPNDIPRLGLAALFRGEVSADVFVGSLAGNADTATQLLADPTDCAPGAFANAISSFGNLACSFDGSNLNLNSNVALLDRNNQNFTGNNTFTKTVSFNSHVNLGNDVHDVIKTTGTFLTYNGIYAENGGITVNGGDVNVSNGNNVNINNGGALYVDGISTLNGDVTANNNVTVQGNATVDGTSTLNGDVNLGDAASDAINVNGRLFGLNGGPVTVGRLGDNNDFKVWGGGDFRGDVNVGGFNANNASLTVLGNTTLGNSSSDTLGVTATSTFNGTVTVKVGSTSALNVVDSSSNSVFQVDTLTPQTNFNQGNVDIFNGNLRLHGNNIRQVNNIGTSGNRANKLWVTNVDASNTILATTFTDGTATLTGGNLTNVGNINTAGAPGSDAYFATFHGALNGNADTATALAADPGDCTLGGANDRFAVAIDAQGNLTCDTISNSDLSGTTVAYTDAANVFTAPQTIKVTDTNALLVQNAGGDLMFSVDSAANQVNVGSALNGAGLYVANGDITVDGVGALVVSNGNIQAVAGQFIGDGGGLTNIQDSALSANVAKYNDAAPNFTNTVTAAGFMGPLTGNVTGDVTGNLFGNADTATKLAANGTNCDPATTGFAVGVDESGNGECATDGSGLTGVNADSLGGTAAAEYLQRDGSVAMTGDLDVGNQDITNANNISFGGQLSGGSVASVTIDNTVTGDGAGFTNLQGAAVSGAVGSATALATDPADCAAGTYAKAIAANGDLTCGTVAASEVSGLGTMAVQNASSVNITGGTVDGVAITNSSFSGTTLTLSGAAIFNSTATFNSTVTATSVVDLTGATSVKLPISAAAITDGVTACAQQARIVFTTASNHVFVCDGTVWQQLD